MKIFNIKIILGAVFLLSLFLAGNLSAQETNTNVVVAAEEDVADLLPDVKEKSSRVIRQNTETRIGFGGGFNKLPLVVSELAVFLFDIGYTYWFADTRDEPFKIGLGINLAMFMGIIPVPQVEVAMTYPMIGKSKLGVVGLGLIGDPLAGGSLTGTSKIGFIPNPKFEIAMYFNIFLTDTKVMYKDIFKGRIKIKELQKGLDEDGQPYGSTQGDWYFLVMTHFRIK